MKLPLDTNNVLRFSHQRHSTSHHVASRTLARLPSLVQRDTGSSSTCAPDNTSAICQKPAESGNAGTLTIALAAAIPTVAAFVVLFFLHRRIRRKQRLEDANDKHKSLDFGLNDVSMSRQPKGGNGSRAPEMSSADMEKSARNLVHGRGVSLDMGSPYLLPAVLQDSNESFHSMSRSMPDREDPYRPVVMARNDSDSVYTAANRGVKKDNASTYTRSSDRSADANANLLKNASRISRSKPYDGYSPESEHSERFGAAQGTIPSRKGSFPVQPAPTANRQSRQYQQPLYSSQNPSLAQPAPASILPSQAQHHAQLSVSEYGGHDLGIDFSGPKQALQVTPHPPPAHQQFRQPATLTTLATSVEQPVTSYSTDLQVTSPDMRRVSVMGLRPLPLDDPTDNPEQRANRIRSFYKEYFDDSKPNPAGHYPQYNPYDTIHETESYDDGAMYDPETGTFIDTAARPSFAQSTARQAMTPLTNRADQHQGRARSNSSFQSTSHGNNLAFRQAPRPAQPKKKLPPPITLTSLPTPHMIKYDTAFSPIDFAPPTTFRDRQLGRSPDSPTGIARPYSPMVPAHNPLIRSFDDLSVMPSPHALRKSSTFTGLDFAPPPRFRNEGSNASDSGSIRSNRSGISALQQEAVRAGAYRVSRIPKEMVGTSADLATALRPQWDMRK